VFLGDVTVSKKDDKSSSISGAIEDLLLYIIDNNITEIVPKFSFQLGFYYSEAMRTSAKFKVSEEELLDRLVKESYATKELYDKYVRCPVCKSYRLLVQFKCPHCGSTNVNKVTLVSHVPCGYIGVLEEMKTSNKKRVCSKCGKELGKKDKDWIRIGSLYKCNECGELFEMPSVQFKCVNCGKIFDYKDAEYENICKYKINLEKIRKLTKQIVIRTIINVLKEDGIAVEVNPTLQGLSGLKHTASLLAKCDGREILIDILSEDEIDDIMSIYGKIIDLGHPDHLILVPSDTAQSLTVDETVLKIVKYDKVSDVAQLIREKIILEKEKT